MKIEGKKKAKWTLKEHFRKEKGLIQSRSTAYIVVIFQKKINKINITGGKSCPQLV